MHIKLLFLLIVTTLLSGCFGPNRYLVQATYEKGETYNRKPTMTKTRAYDSLYKEIKTIAVRAPDNCNNETAAQASGEATRDTVLQTYCGTVMASIERELAMAGYNVISWNELNSSIEVSRLNQNALTPLQAADKLNADALLKINSFERTYTHPGRDARWDVRYYKADEDGKNLGVAQVDGKINQQLQGFAKHCINSQKNKRIHSATVDASITHKTGQIIWFYRWTNVERLDSQQSSKDIYVSCDEGRCKEFELKKIVTEDKNRRFKGYTIGDNRIVTPEDESKAIHKELMQDLVHQMVVSFAGSKFN